MFARPAALGRVPETSDLSAAGRGWKPGRAGVVRLVLRVFGGVCSGGLLVGSGVVVAVPEAETEVSFHAVNGGEV